VVFVGSADGDLYALETDGIRTSNDSRVLLGALGHHDGWQHGGGSIAAVSRVTQLSRLLGPFGLTALTAGVGTSVASLLYAGLRSPRGGDSADPYTRGSGGTLELTSGLLLICIGALLSLLFSVTALPTGSYSLWRLDVAPILTQRLMSGRPAAFAVTAGLLGAWLLFGIGFLQDRRQLVRARQQSTLRTAAPQIAGIPSLKFGIAAALVPVATVLGLPWVGVAFTPPVLAVGYFLHRTSILSTGERIWTRIGNAGTAGSKTADGSDSSTDHLDVERRDNRDRTESGTSVFETEESESSTADREGTESDGDDTETRIFAVCSGCGADLSAHGYPDVCPDCGTEQ
jgi:hypothetical protein